MNAQEFFDKNYLNVTKNAEKFREKFPHWYNFLHELEIVPYTDELHEERMEILSIMNEKPLLDGISLEVSSYNGHFGPSYYQPKTNKLAFVHEHPSFLTFLSETGRIYFAARDEYWYPEHCGAMLLVMMILSERMKFRKISPELAVINLLDLLSNLGAEYLGELHQKLRERDLAYKIAGHYSTRLNFLLLEGIATFKSIGQGLQDYIKELVEFRLKEPDRHFPLQFVRYLLLLAPVSRRCRTYLMRLLGEKVPISVKKRSPLIFA